MIGLASDTKYKAEGRNNFIGLATDAKYIAEGRSNMIGTKRTANTQLMEEAI